MIPTVFYGIPSEGQTLESARVTRQFDDVLLQRSDADRELDFEFLPVAFRNENVGEKFVASAEESDFFTEVDVDVEAVQVFVEPVLRNPDVSGPGESDVTEKLDFGVKFGPLLFRKVLSNPLGNTCFGIFDGKGDVRKVGDGEEFFGVGIRQTENVVEADVNERYVIEVTEDGFSVGMLHRFSMCRTDPPFEFLFMAVCTGCGSVNGNRNHGNNEDYPAKNEKGKHESHYIMKSQSCQNHLQEDAGDL